MRIQDAQLCVVAGLAETDEDADEVRGQTQSAAEGRHLIAASAAGHDAAVVVPGSRTLPLRCAAPFAGVTTVRMRPTRQ
jgi:hypothetical protein